MFISEERKNENIAEYVLYMWQVEDLIRSCNFNIKTIEGLVINATPVSEDARKKIKSWYEDVILEMTENGLKSKGHIEEVQLLVSEMHYLHTMLINIYQDAEYIKLYELAGNSIHELRKRSNGSVKTDVETCLTGLYGVLLLKIQKKEVTQDTLEAIKSMHALLTYLSVKYRQMKDGTLQLPKVREN